MLNLTTGSITTQFRVVFDDHNAKFNTKFADHDAPTVWEAMSGIEADKYIETMFTILCLWGSTRIWGQLL